MTGPGVRRRPGRVAALGLAAGLLLTGCGGTDPPAPRRASLSAPAAIHIPARLLAEMRPIGAGVRFHPPVRGRPTGVCAPRPGREEAHLELFGANRVVLIAAGVGIRGRCVGNAVTTDPTGVVHFRPGATLADLFRAWGEPLTATRMASFRGPVRYYLDGRRVSHPPALREHAEIVIEVGPYVPPHVRFTFPPGL
ncbi:hypothetical protein [Conexibacter sp. DBS9H8]|uniref:hypothetical protein n=1 Tax=Conexibacter sp. DBS9H8 TaxID=2937801 RepID=UPI00200C9462|nr:hypothetical protein [Conexibacter sp. DBS9H8]